MQALKKRNEREGSETRQHSFCGCLPLASPESQRRVHTINATVSSLAKLGGRVSRGRVLSNIAARKMGPSTACTLSNGKLNNDKNSNRSSLGKKCIYPNNIIFFNLFDKLILHPCTWLYLCARFVNLNRKPDLESFTLERSFWHSCL